MEKLIESKDYFALAAHLANPYLSIPSAALKVFDQESFSFNQLHLVMQENKVLFRTLLRFEDPIFPSEKRDILKSMVEKQAVFHKSYELLLCLKARISEATKNFEDHNVDFMFLKSRNSLPVDSDNFDILITEKALPTAMSLLENLGYVEVSWISEPYKRLFVKVRNAENYMSIHLHTKMAWDGIEFVNCSDLWAKHEKRMVEGVNVGFPSREHHMLITSAHAFFENHSFKLGDLIYTVEDAQLERQIDWKYLERWVTDNNWSVAFYYLLKLQNYLHISLYGKNLFEKESFRLTDEKKNAKAEELFRASASRFIRKRSLPLAFPVTIVARQYINKIRKDSELPTTRKINSIASISGQYARRRILKRKRPAFLVSFSGQDETGKTTHAYHLYRELESRGIKTSYIWSRGTGLTFEPFLRLARKLLLGKAQAETSEVYQQRRQKTLGVEPLRLFWGYLTIMDHLLQIIIRVRTALLLNTVVICDRYIYDTLYDAKYDLDLSLNDFAHKALETITPSPAVAFVMKNNRSPPGKFGVTTKGKGTQTCSSIRTLMSIDTTKPVGENATNILSTVLREYYTSKQIVTCTLTLDNLT